MNYDWEKIFKNKTTKELYDIATGKTFLTREAIDFAIKELENRGFKTEDISIHRKAWRLSHLISESEYEYTFSSSTYISLKSYIIIVILFSIISFSLLALDIIETLLGIAFITILVFIENLSYKIKKERQIKRFKRMEQLDRELNQLVPENKKKQIIKELNKQKEKTDKEIKLLATIFFIISTIVSIIFFVLRLINMHK